MGDLLGDVRYGVRTLSKSPGFTVLAVLILAIGIGANTSVFSLVNATKLSRASTVQDSSSLVVVGESNAGTPLPLSYSDYSYLRERATTISGLLCFTDSTFSMSLDGEPERVHGSLVSGNFFSTLGVEALIGRPIMPEDDQPPGEHAVAVLGHAFWQRRFGGDTGAVGRTLKLNGQIFTVIGVAPDGFNGTDSRKRRDVWVPAMMAGRMGPDLKDILTGADMRSVAVIGRLNPGATLDQVRAEMSTLSARLASAHRRRIPLEGIEARELDRLRSSGEDLSAVLGVMVVVALILVIACANVANMLLARAGARKKEIAIRLAVGAGRARLIRQLLTESLLLSFAAGLAGLLLSLWATDLIWMLVSMNAGSDELIRLRFGVDVSVLGYALALSFLTGIIFGLAPALQSTKGDLVPALKDGDRSSGYRRSKLRNALAVSQVTVSLVLLILAALFVKTTLNQRASKAVGEDRSRMLLSIAPGDQGYAEAGGMRFYQRLVENVKAIPGVEAAGMADAVNISGVSGDSRAVLEGADGRAERPARRVSVQRISPGFFDAMGFRLAQGRDFNDEDRSGAAGVVIVNETMARASWPGESPSGKRLRVQDYDGESGPLLQVVGVVSDPNDRAAFGKAVPAIYLPVAQNYSREMMLVVKSGAGATPLLASVTREVHALDPDMPVFNARTMSEHVNQLLATERQISAFVSIAGLIALALASVGLYGVISYTVSQRTHEIGVRMAMGAQPRDVFRMVLGEGVKLALTGIAAGIAISAVVTRAIASELYGVSPLDPRVYGGVAALLIAVSVVASFVPARKATRVDPVVALRYE